MTQKIKFQWFFDIATSDQSMQIITVSAGGSNVIRRLMPFFTAYKQYRLGKVKCTFVPASTLPVDPTGLSYTAGDSLVDPRDQLTPGMTRITNGEDFIDDITGLTPEDQTRLYNSMMLDSRWYKWSLQSGLKRSAFPKYWQIGQLHQDYFPGATINLPQCPNSTGALTSTGAGHEFQLVNEPTVVRTFNQPNFTDPRGIFQTGHKGVLGWMPTDALIHYANNGGMHDASTVAPIPCIELFKILLPRALKTKYYYRVYVSEEVLFRAPITFPYTNTENGQLMGLDRFVFQKIMDNVYDSDIGIERTNNRAVNSPGLTPPNDGGGATREHD